MKTRILSFLAAVAAILTFLGGLDLSGIASILPDTVATAFATALPLFAGVVHLVKALADLIDDGQINGSIKVLALFLVAGALCGPLTSCAGLGSAITGQPIATVPVQRVEGGVPFEVAASDVLRAETQPGRQWGLYDAGLVAAKGQEVIASGK